MGFQRTRDHRDFSREGKQGEISRIVSKDGALCFWSKSGRRIPRAATIVAINRVPFSPPLCAIRARFMPGRLFPGYGFFRQHVSRFSRHYRRAGGLGISRGSWLARWLLDQRRGRPTCQNCETTVSRSVGKTVVIARKKIEREREREKKGTKSFAPRGDGHSMKTNLLLLSQGGKLRHGFCLSERRIEMLPSRGICMGQFISEKEREKFPNFSTSPLDDVSKTLALRRSL